MSWQKLLEKRAAIKPDTLVVGVDIAKREHVGRIVFPDGTFSGPLPFGNDRAGFELLLASIGRQRQQADCRRVMVGLESTGVYWMNLAYWLEAQGISVVQVNPLHVHRSKETLDNSPAKTDGKDALLIADLVAQGKYLSFVMPHGIHAELRQLVLLRDHLARVRTTQIVRLHLSVSGLFPEFCTVFPDLSSRTARLLLYHFSTPDAVRAATPAAMDARVRRAGRVRLRPGQLAALKERAAVSIGIEEGRTAAVRTLRDALTAFADVEQRLAGVDATLTELLAEIDESRYLMSVIGIATVTAATVLGETGGLSRYHNAQAVLKLAGLDLYEISSGEHRGQRRISKRGRPRLRRILYFAALHHTIPGTPLYDSYARLVDRGVPRIKAVVATSCRLVRLLYALVRDQRCYGEQPPTAVTSRAA